MATVEEIEEALSVLAAVDSDAREIASVDVERGLPVPRVQVTGLLFGSTHQPVVEPETPLIEAADFWSRFRLEECVRAVWWRPRPDSPAGQAARYEAAQRLADAFPLPVYFTRQRRVIAQLCRDAEEHGQTLDTEMRGRVIAACFENLPSISFAGLLAVPNRTQIEAAARDLPGALNMTVSDDVLGPGWRQPQILKMTPTDEAKAEVGRDLRNLHKDPRKRRTWREGPSPRSASVGDLDELSAPGLDPEAETGREIEKRTQLEILMAFHEREASPLERTLIDEVVSRITRPDAGAATSVVTEALAAVGQPGNYMVWQKIQRKARRRLATAQHPQKKVALRGIEWVTV